MHLFSEIMGLIPFLALGMAYDATGLFTAARTQQDVRHLGTWTDLMEGGSFTATNKDDAAVDVWTGTITTVTAVTFTPPGGSVETATVNSETTAATAIADLLNPGINPSSSISMWYALTSPSSTIIATKRLAAATNGTFTTGGGVTWAHTTTGALGSDVPVGRLVLRSGSMTSAGFAGSPTFKACDQLTAQVITFATTFQASATYQVDVTVKSYVNGEDAVYSSGKIVADTDSATTATAIVAGLNSGSRAFPAVSVVAATTSGGGWTLTAEAPGIAFDVVVTLGGTNNSTALTYTYTTGAVGDPTTDLNAAKLGLLTRDSATTEGTSSAPVVQPTRQGRIGRRGYGTVLNSQTIVPGSAVWVDVTTGKLYNAGSAAGLVPLPRSQAWWMNSAAGSPTGYAVVQLAFSS